ncbi:hypothetical protein L3X38_003552 [Prunus dulcis]|uniref:Uncharacterized protein n=1 Tax=Prunus dulcis TaxID=3755 RepID=A0AAD4ZMA0_PRUDU|nr:hypothetical protein L3X38_003552 [Prunus dulcis]
MASSFPSSLDLNLAPPTQTWAQGVAPLEVFENSGKRKRDHERNSRERGVIIRASSDEPQEAMRENSREEIQRAKLKAPIVEL